MRVGRRSPPRALSVPLALLGALAVGGPVGCGGAAPQVGAVGVGGRLAVLEFQAPPAITEAEAAWLAEVVRAVAVRLPAERFAVLTPANAEALLGPGRPLGDCVGACEVETGRRLGADYVITGEVLPVGGALRVVLALYATESAALLGSERAAAPGVAGLEAAVEAAAVRLLRPLMVGGEQRVRPRPGGLVRVEPGTFVAGSPSGEPGRRSHEVQTPVRIERPFLLGRTEVTQGEWRAHFPSQPARFGGCDDCPVERVTYAEAAAWLNAQSAQDGLPPCYRLLGCRGAPGAAEHRCAEVHAVPGCRGWRLPSQDEWTYAARAGEVGAVPGGDLRLEAERHAPGLERHAWYGGNSAVESGDGVPCGDWIGRPPGVTAARCGTHPVGALLPNAWGLYDMLGNVAEWTDTGSGVGADATRSVRGGSFRSPAVGLRFAAGATAPVAQRADEVGFRRCRTVD